MSRVLVICSTCGGDADDCRVCDGAGTLVLNEKDLQDTDIVVDSNYDDDAETP